MLQDNLLVQSSRVKQSREDGNNRLFPYFGKKLPFYDAQNPKRVKISVLIYKFNFGYLSIKNTIFTWARMWGFVVILWSQEGSMSKKNVGNTALEGFAYKTTKSFARSTVPRIRCPACFYVAWDQNSFTEFWCSLLLSKYCCNEYILYLHSIQFDKLTQFKVTIPVQCDDCFQSEVLSLPYQTCGANTVNAISGTGWSDNQQLTKTPITFYCSITWQHLAPLPKGWPLIIGISLIILIHTHTCTPCYVCSDKVNH
jgi:hypothetical protein